MYPESLSVSEYTGYWLGIFFYIQASQMFVLKGEHFRRLDRNNSETSDAFHQTVPSCKALKPERRMEPTILFTRETFGTSVGNAS